MSILRRFAHVLIVLAMPAVLILTPMYLFITPEFVRHEYRQPRFPPPIRFAPQERIALSDAIIFYVRGRTTREQLQAVRTLGDQPAMTEREIDHLTDVREVMLALFVTHGATTALIVAASALLIGASGRELLSAALRQGTYLTAALLAIILGAALANFDVFFTAFHRIFFVEGTWLFDLSDTLIQLYPLPLWIDAVWKMGAVIAFEAAAVHLVARYVRRARTRYLRPGARQRT